jgi:hypothetical protein
VEATATPAHAASTTVEATSTTAMEAAASTSSVASTASRPNIRPGSREGNCQ